MKYISDRQPTTTDNNRQQPTTTDNRPKMRDLFNNYNTGLREWTYHRKQFDERSFHATFDTVLPNEYLHAGAAAFLAVTHIDVLRFSVPMNGGHPDLRRDVLFIEIPNSQYWKMFSFMHTRNTDVDGAFDDNNAHSGALCEYDILDLIEPSNESHQRALIETWFDIDNWFETLRAYALENAGEIEDVINGRAPEPLNAAADVFIPELIPMHLQMHQHHQHHQHQPAAIAAWNVRDLI